MPEQQILFIVQKRWGPEKKPLWILVLCILKYYSDVRGGGVSKIALKYFSSHDVMDFSPDPPLVRRPDEVLRKEKE